MKIEICENTFWLAMWSLIAITIINIVGIGCYLYIKDHENAFKYGYQESTLPGQVGSAWVKIK